MLFLLTVVFFWPQLVGGKALYWGDIGLYFLPMQTFLHDNLRQGRLPLWNPLILCGAPYVGNPQTWPLYPVTLLLGWMSAPQFLNWTVALHVWLAGLGTYLFARRALTLGRGAALLSAITFMFGGQLVSKEQFPNMVQAIAWLPWVLLCLDGTLRRRRVRDALQLGLVLGLQLLAAHVQMTVLTLYLALAYGVFVLKAQKAPPAPLIELALLLLLSGTVAAGLAMAQILPTLALFRDAARQRLPFHIVNRFFLPSNELGNFVLPRLHGHPFYGDWTARGNFWETCCYVGWISFALALWGMVAAWQKGGAKPVRFWTVVFVLGVWMALGGSGGLYHLAYYIAPGFRAFHDPARCLLWACFALSLLAGYGWEKIAPPPQFWGARLGEPIFFRFPQNWGRGGLLLLLAFADLAHFGRTLYSLADPATLSPASPIVAAVQADPDVQSHQARFLAPSAGVWLRFSSPKDFRQNVPEYQSRWADTMTPNLMMPYGLADAYGYEPVTLKNAETTAGRAAHAFDPKAPADQQKQAARWAGALGVKYVIVCRVHPPEMTLPGLLSVRADPTLAPAGKKRQTAGFVYLSQDAQWQPRARLEGSVAPVTLRDDGPDKVTLNFTTIGPARLVLADTPAAGWQATLDGRRALIGTKDGLLRTVVVSQPGVHTVIFSYRPTPFRLGLYLSLLTVASLAAYAARAQSRKIFGRAGFARRSVE